MNVVNYINSAKNEDISYVKTMVRNSQLETLSDLIGMNKTSKGILQYTPFGCELKTEGRQGI